MRRKKNNGERRWAAQMHALAVVRREIPDSARTSKYLREFTQAFRTYDAPLTPEQLEEKIARAGILLIGDYHALPQSQRFASGIIERLTDKRPVVLGVEAVLARDQRVLDSWWRREIGEDELRRRLRFDRDWGYDWLPLYELVSMARDRAEGLYALDCLPRNDLRRIRSRDRHAAEKIREIRLQHPRASLVVLFGESHMAPGHLPSVLRQFLPEENIVTMLQNVDALYWQATKGHSPAAVSVQENVVCVFNSTPLEKYESFRLCLEKWNGDDQPDFAPAVYNLIFSLARSLGFHLDSRHNGTQPRYLADSLPEVVSADEVFVDAPQPVLEQNGCVYLPETNTFVLREFKMAGAAAECARFLYHACHGFPADRCQRRLEAALAHFGSRLLCPGNSSESGDSNDLGEQLYQSYLAGRLSKATLRKVFLAAEDDPVVKKTLEPMSLS